MVKSQWLGIAELEQATTIGTTTIVVNGMIPDGDPLGGRDPPFNPAQDAERIVFPSPRMAYCYYHAARIHSIQNLISS
jgi:hypothetical protein